MTSATSLYRVPVEFDPASLIGSLGGDHAASVAPWVRTTKTFFDSFDWRLYDHATVLLEERIGQQVSITWQSRATGAPLAILSGYGVPRFVADLPISPMRQRLAACLEMRALLPLVRIESRRRICEILDGREKVIARLVQESWTLAPDQKNQSLRARKPEVLSNKVRVDLSLNPVKGFENECRALEVAIRGAPGATAQETDSFTLALADLGQRPGEYSSKLSLSFPPEMRSDFALRLILQQLLDTLETTLPGTRADLDSEFLHDFRVAIRRARSALGQIKGVLPRDQTDRMREELSWLGQATGPMRDLDVYLLKLDDYSARPSEPHRSAIEPLRAFLQRQKGRVHKDLCRDLRSRRFNRLLKDWRHLAAQSVEAGPPAGDETPKAGMAVGQLSAGRIHRAYRRVLKDGAKIGPETPAEALHELRKDCKKLRYLMEFFRSLYPDKDIGKAIKVLKNLQENLGDFQDFEVQQDQLRSYGREMSVAGLMCPATEAGILALVRHLEDRQTAARREFAARFKNFSAKSNRQRFERLFAGPAKRGGKAAGKSAQP